MELGVAAFLGFMCLVLFLYLWQMDFRHAMKEAGSFRSFRLTRKWRESLYFLGVILISLSFVQFSGLDYALKSSYDIVIWPASIVLAALISGFWLFYLRKIDAYESEPWWAVVLTLVMSFLSIMLVFPASDFVNSLGFDLNGDPWNDWWYCVIGIGMIEEIVKILPFLIILRFTKEVNEPFDYIFYGSLSALGFAFVENSMYIANYDLMPVHGRALYSTVAHMFFTSIVVYTMAITKFRFVKYKGFSLLLGLALASLAHGFYDFWLINTQMKSVLMTTVFLIISIHLWTVMKNNLINLSPMFVRGYNFAGRDLSYRLINWFITVFYLAYIIFFLMFGRSQANQFLILALVQNIYMMLFVALTFGSYEPIQGYVANLSLNSFNLRFFIPRFSYSPSVTGDFVQIDIHSKRNQHIPELDARQLFPLRGKLVRRIVFRGSTDCYLVEVDKDLGIDGVEPRSLLLVNKSRDESASSTKAHVVWLYALRNWDDVPFGEIHPHNTMPLGGFIVRGIPAFDISSTSAYDTTEYMEL